MTPFFSTSALLLLLLLLPLVLTKLSVGSPSLSLVVAAARCAVGGNTGAGTVVVVGDFLVSLCTLLLLSLATGVDAAVAG